MEINNMNNCIMKIEFDYRNDSRTIELEDQKLCDSILLEIRKMEDKTRVWFPNDEIDNSIRKYISEKIKDESYYAKGIRPSYMVIKLDEIPYHIIHDYYSEDEYNKKISNILKDYAR